MIQRSEDSLNAVDVAEYAPDFAALPPLQLHRLEVPIPASHTAQSTEDDKQRKEGGGQEWSAPGTLRVMPHMAHYESDFPKVRGPGSWTIEGMVVWIIENTLDEG